MNHSGPIRWEETSLVLLPGLDGTGGLFSAVRDLDWGGMRPEIRSLPSGPQDYESLAAALAPGMPDGDLVLLAESFSTPLAMWLARLLGPRVRALVLVAGFCTAPHPSGLGWLPLRPLFSLPPPTFFLRRFLTGENPPSGLPDGLASALRQTGGAVLAERLRVVLALREQDCPPPGETPVLLLQAGQDRLIPWEAQSGLERHFPEAMVEWIDGPHLLLQSRPRECRDAAIRFLATAVPRPDPAG